MTSAAFALFLLLAPEDPSPEKLWARLLDPSIRTAERIEIAKKAGGVLPPEYIARVAAFEVAYEEGHGRGDMKRIVEHLAIPTRDADPYELVRNLPCGTDFEGKVILQTLRRFAMNAESYGVVRNYLTPHAGEFLSRELPVWWAYSASDDRNAAQAFIVEASLMETNNAPRINTEILFTLSQTMFDLEKMLQSLHPFPATAFLALADRIERDAYSTGSECMGVYDAVRILQVTDHPLFDEKPMQSRDECLATLDIFRLWLEDHRAELEAAASKDAVAVEDARRRMQRVTLCRP